MSVTLIGGDAFEWRRGLVEVSSSLPRPDPDWRHGDAGGHEHRWYVGGRQAAGEYDPSIRYETPTLRFVRTGWGYYEDGSRYAVGHRECGACRERVEPGTCVDVVRRYATGPAEYLVNGAPVGREEFERRLRAARVAAVPAFGAEDA